MKIDFEALEGASIPNFKGGEGVTEAKMFFDGTNRIMIARIKPGSSIGMHTHETSMEVMFFLSGKGKAVCNGEEEIVSAGSCHYCPKGSTHTVINTCDEDLVMYCVVANQ